MVEKLSEREINFIIQALRYWQRDMDMDGFVSDLSSNEVTELCDRLKPPYALVTISGGVGDLALAEGCDVDILDFDNLKEETPETVFLSDREWAYLKEHDLDEYNRLRVPLQTA